MSEFKKLLFIINKFSGRGYQPQLEGNIIKTCAEHNIECSIEFTKGRGHASGLAKNGVGIYDAVIAVGGDGTVNEVSQGLVNSNTPLGIIPKGSGNGLARHLGIPLGISSALDALIRGEKISIDTFRMNGQLSVNVSGIGFDGHVANLFGQHKQRGFWGYASLVVKEYFRYPEFEVELITARETTHHKCFIIAIANSSQFGNNAYIAPNASVTDGLLNIPIVRKIPLCRGVSFGYRMFSRNLRNSDWYTGEIQQRFTIQTSIPMAYHIDGEPCGLSKMFTIEILPGSLGVIVPDPLLKI